MGKSGAGFISARGALVVSLVVLVTMVLQTSAVDAADATVVFLARHAEKIGTGADAELAVAGHERALELARVLREANIDAVYSTDFRRTRDTAAPLAQALGLTVRLYDWDETDALVAELTGLPGRRLVVGHSDTTPDLVELLGGEPGAAIDEAVEYDRLYQVSLDAAGNATTVLLRYGRDTPAGSSAPP